MNEGSFVGRRCGRRSERLFFQQVERGFVDALKRGPSAGELFSRKKQATLDQTKLAFHSFKAMAIATLAERLGSLPRRDLNRARGRYGLGPSQLLGHVWRAVSSKPARASWAFSDAARISCAARAMQFACGHAVCARGSPAASTKARKAASPRPPWSFRRATPPQAGPRGR